MEHTWSARKGESSNPVNKNEDMHEVHHYDGRIQRMQSHVDARMPYQDRKAWMHNQEDDNAWRSQHDDRNARQYHEYQMLQEVNQSRPELGKKKKNHGRRTYHYDWDKWMNGFAKYGIYDSNNPPKSVQEPGQEEVNDVPIQKILNPFDDGYDQMATSFNDFSKNSVYNEAILEIHV